MGRGRGTSPSAHSQSTLHGRQRTADAHIVTTTRNHTATPPSFVVFAMVGGLLFILGGIVTAMSANARAVMIAAAIAFLLLGVYAISIATRHNARLNDIRQLEDEITAIRSSDAGLRARLGFTLRDPLTTVVGLADRMLTEPDLAAAERQTLLTEIRNSAREVEKVLADLSIEPHDPARQLRAAGIVLVDDEVRSIVSTVGGTANFTVDLRPARAWGDSAHVRQVLRSLIGTAGSSGCENIEIITEQRGKRATVTISGRSAMLPAQAAAALTGNTEAADATSDAFIALKEARDLAIGMGGTIGYAEAFGKHHIVAEFEGADDIVPHRIPATIGSSPSVIPTEAAPGNRYLTFASTADLRPERPTASIRFS